MDYNFKGVYNNTTTYVTKDVVSMVSNDITKFYMCLLDNTIGQPPNPNADSKYWGLMNTRSDFPNTIDSFSYKADIQVSDQPDMIRISQLRSKANLTTTEQNELNSLIAKHRNKFNLASDVNALQDSLSNMQFFFKDKIDGKLNQNIQEIDQGKTNALNAIDKKMENVIEYMDGTTAGQIRNDLGAMGELTTTDKSSLVSAINEVNNKAVDLSPIESQITNLENSLNEGSQNLSDLQKTVTTHIGDNVRHLTDDDREKLDSLQTAKIYGVRIDKANSNPNTAVTYIDDAVGMTGGANNWDNVYPFNQIKPCLFKNGKVNYYLNSNDFTKKVDGTNADITSGNDGDVMIEFPKIYWKITSNNEEIRVQFSNKRIDERWKCLAHTKGEIEKEKVYIGAYLGNALSFKLRSLSTKSPTANQTIGTFRTQAQANGIGYQQMGYYQLLMLQILYLVRYKNLDSQTALGRGYVDGNSAAIATGGTNTKGMNFGEKSGKQQMKFCGIEDFYGNCFHWIDGLFCDSSRNILIGDQNFNDNGSGYSNFGQGGTVNLSGYINDVQGGSETGFIVKAVSGSATTYYSDYGVLSAGCLPVFGASLSGGSSGGAFQLRVSYSASSSYAYVSARLCYI